MTIPTLPPVPSPNDPATFSDKADAWNAALPAWGAAIEAAGQQTAADAVNTAAAAAAAASAAVVAGAVVWVSGTTYAVGDARYSPADLQTYRRKTNGAGTTDPSADPANWQLANIQATLARSARTSNTMLGAADRAALIDITSGTFSQTFDAAATLTAGWWCWVRNSGTGTITLDPSGAELIDGAATLALAPGFAVLVTCSGTAFTTLLVAPYVGDHVVTVETGNGHGSTNTKIRRFTTTQVNTGTAITYADSAANGASFTINQPGLYEVHTIDEAAASGQVGASVNSAQLTTSILSITAANRICAATIASGITQGVTRTVRLAAGDVVRPHTDGASTVTTAGRTLFSIRKVGV